MISHVLKFEADTINALGGDSVYSRSKIGTKSYFEIEIADNDEIHKREK